MGGSDEAALGRFGYPRARSESVAKLIVC